MAGPIPLSTALERVRWLGATVFWGNLETQVGVVRGSSGKGSTSPEPRVALDFQSTSGH